MPCNYYDDLNDSGLFADDKIRRERDAKACQLHLKDLMRCHGPTPDRRLKGNRKGKEKASIVEAVPGRHHIQPAI